ncbi:F0F1 ATP synthase subunit A [Pedobacter duraquae]|uniref:ATP synthase subunit a n=1 Tax=Pedobacter duraquae TaxID=425511 RepID=A0A4R6II23_9SPHI|nr:F0F1 ATP synthase subunit A [Pedobacter duraquae]TDO21599.1 ATP synthase F0 subcomplex A subunit [Pedobacter duraquae]
MDCSHVFVSKVNRLIVAFTLFLAFFCVVPAVNAQTDTVAVTAEQHAEAAVESHAAGEGHEEEKFDPTKVIMEHVSDSHVFHIWGHLSMPLPVILYTPQGIEFFSSGHFHHGEEDYKGKYYTYRLVQPGMQAFSQDFFNRKIKVVGADGKVDDALTAGVLDFSITKNVASLFLTVFLLIVIFTSVAAAYRTRVGKSPKGLQSFLEPIIIFVRDDIARPNIGHDYAKFMPYLLTVFFFILINNLLGLIPIFPGSSNVTGNIAVTFVLSLITMVIININGNKYYWKHIFAPDVPKWMYIIMIPVELIGIVSKPFALMIRLFANITAGHIIVLSLISLIFIFKSVSIAPVSVAFVIFMDVLELLVAFLQAFIFTLLSSLFIGMAIEEHH